ncbi:MAG: hypothetical protein R3293_11860 [Candidatus Promineifilaceae bacterium]|nr:hypothetical protein [Candidatus Promineifilaceae bacterium]
MRPRYLSIHLIIVLLIILTACNGTTPAADPEGNPGVLWNITLVKETPGSFKVTKTIWEVVERDRRYEAVGEGRPFDMTSRCEPQGAVNIGENDNYIEFGPGGYLACRDIGIPAEFGDLEDLISTDDCVGEQPCMRPPTLVITAEVRISDPGIHYTLFDYPQTSTADVEDARLTFGFQGTPDIHEIDWQVYGSSGGGLEPLGDDALVPVESNPNEFFVIGVNRANPEAPNFSYWVNNRAEAVAGSSILNAETEFEFFPQENVFYIGPRNDTLPGNATLQLGSLDFDPADSCVGCN